MLEKMRNMLRTGLGREHVAEFENVRATWARLVDSYAAVPAAYRAFFEPIQSQDRVFPYTVLAPSLEGILRPGAEKLVCALGREIHILERKGQSFEAQCFPVDQISLVEVCTILLSSRIRITGVTAKGQPASAVIKFNSVTDYLFVPVLKAMRLGARGGAGGAETPTESFERWVRLNFKFMNYARRSLLPGDQVLAAILQPEIRADVFRLFGHQFRRTLAPAHVCILTGRELILIREEERRSGDKRYGGIWDYIPLRRVESLTLLERDGLPVLSVRLPHEARLECLFEAAHRAGVAELIARFEQLQPTTFLQEQY